MKMKRVARYGPVAFSAQSGKRALEPPQHLLHTPFGDHFHHFLRLFELREQTVDFLHRYAGARGDAALARCLEQFRLRPLGRGHRVDDSLDAANRAFVDLIYLRRTSKLAGKFVEQALHPSHLPHLSDSRLVILEFEALAVLDLVDALIASSIARRPAVSTITTS